MIGALPSSRRTVQSTIQMSFDKEPLLRRQVETRVKWYSCWINSRLPIVYVQKKGSRMLKMPSYNNNVDTQPILINEETLIRNKH